MAGMIIKGRDGRGVHTHDTSTNAGKFYANRSWNGIHSCTQRPSVVPGQRTARTDQLVSLVATVCWELSFLFNPVLPITRSKVPVHLLWEYISKHVILIRYFRGIEKLLHLTIEPFVTRILHRWITLLFEGRCRRIFLFLLKYFFETIKNFDCRNTARNWQIQEQDTEWLTNWKLSCREKNEMGRIGIADAKNIFIK